MLCKLCSRFRIEGLLKEHRQYKAKGELMPGQETSYRHRFDSTDLFNSASAGCSLCEYIYQSLRKQVNFESDLHHPHFDRYQMHYGSPQIYFGCHKQPPQRDVPEIVVSQRTTFETFRTIA